MSLVYMDFNLGLIHKDFFMEITMVKLSDGKGFPHIIFNLVSAFIYKYGWVSMYWVLLMFYFICFMFRFYLVFL